MIRISTTLVALALFASATLVASAQQPPPEGPPQAQNPYAPSATTSSAPNPAMLARAKTWFAHLQAGTIDRSQLATNANSNLTDATITNAQKMIGNLGRPVSFVQQQASTQGNDTAAIYVVTFKNGKKIDFLFVEDTQGKVEGLGLGTPQ